MKNYLFALSLIFTIVLPLNSALALGLESDKYQGIVNGLYDIGNSIDAQTKMLKDALLQQQMAGLNRECAAILAAEISAKDTYIKETEQKIKDYTAQNAGKPHDASENIEIAGTLNHLYNLIAIQKERYTNIIIRECSIPTLNASCVKANGSHAEMKSYNASGAQCQCVSGYGWNGSACIASQAQQPASPSITGRQCNGKSWGECPTGTTFSCPASGDPQCLSKQPVKVSVSPSNPFLVGGSGGGGGSAGSSTSCDRMVMGRMTHLGDMTEAECYAIWQKAVETAQKKNGSFVAVAMSHPVEAPQVAETASITPEVGAVAASSTNSGVKSESQSYMSRVWAWFSRLLRF